MAGVEKKIKLKRYTGSGTDWDTILPATKADIVTLDPSVTIHGVSQSNVQSAIVQLNTYKVDTGAVLLKVNNTDVTPSDNPVKNVYAPSTGGTENAYARSTGATSAPTWQYPVTDLEGSGITDSTPVLPTTGGVRTYVKNKLTGVYKPKGSSATIPSLSSVEVGDVYDISVAFSVGESDTDWVASARGKSYPAGTNIVAIDDNGTTRWDVLSGIVNWKKLTINKQGTNIEYDGSVAKSVAIGNGALKLKRNGISLRGYNTEFTADSGSDITVNFNDIDDIADVPASDTERLFRFRPAALMPNPYGDISLIANSERLNKVVANTVRFNQLINPSTRSANVASYSDGVYTTVTIAQSTTFTAFSNAFTFVNGHKYAIRYRIYNNSNSATRLRFYNRATSSYNDNITNTAIYTADDSNAYDVNLTYADPNVAIRFSINVTDLTVMYGSGNEPDFNNFSLMYPLYYDYESSALWDTPNYYYETTGVNIWDEVWEVGDYSGSTGEATSTPKYVRSKNFIKVLPSTVYCLFSPNNQGTNERQFVVYFHDANKNYITYTSVNLVDKVFTTPINCQFIHFRNNIENSTYNNDIQLCLHSPDETYQDLFEKVYHPYKKSTALIDWSWTTTGKGKSAGSVADEINFDSNQGIERVKQVKFKDLSWLYATPSGGQPYFWTRGINSDAIRPTNNNYEPNNITYNVPYTKTYMSNLVYIDKPDKSITIDLDGNLTIADSSYTDPTTFKNHFADTDILNYGIINPTYHQLSDYQAKQWYIQNYGTEYLYPVNTSSPFSIPYTYITYSNKVYEVGNSDRLDGKTGDYYLDYNNFNNTPSSLPNPYSITLTGKEPSGGTSQELSYDGSVAKTVQVGENDGSDYAIYPTVNGNTIKLNLGYHGSSATKYGIGTTSLYGHNKIKDGEILNRNIHLSGSDSAVATETDGISASGAHTHFDLNDHEQTVTDSSLLKISGITDNLNLLERSQTEISVVQGKSYSYNQMLKNNKFESMQNWYNNGGNYATASVSDNIYTQTFTSVPSASYNSGIYQSTSNGGEIKYIIGHRYLAMIDFMSNQSGLKMQTLVTYYGNQITTVANTWHHFSQIYLVSGSTVANQGTFLTYANNSTIITVGTYIKYRNPVLIDLDIWFNGNIPTDIVDGTTYYPENFFKYYKGSLTEFGSKIVSSNGNLLNTNRNIWDEITEIGSIDNTTGQNSLDGSNVRAKNYIDVLPDTTYYIGRFGTKATRYYWYDVNKGFIYSGTNSGGAVNCIVTSPSNAHYLRVRSTDTYGNVYHYDCCVSISDTSFNGTYVSHIEDKQPIEELRSAGSFYDTKIGNVITRNVSEYTITGNETVYSYQFNGTSDYIIFVVPTIKGGDGISLPNNLVNVVTVSTSSNVSNHYLAITFIPGVYANLSSATNAVIGKKVIIPLVSPTIETSLYPLRPMATYRNGYEMQDSDVPYTLTRLYDISLKDAILSNVEEDRIQDLMLQQLDEQKEDKSNKTNTLNINSTTEQYPNAKVTYEEDLKAKYHLGIADTVSQSNGITTITRKTGYIDLGDLNYDVNYYGSNTFSAQISNAKLSATLEKGRCSKYNYAAYADRLNSICWTFNESNSNLVVHDTNYSDATVFKAAMQGVILEYELLDIYQFTEKVPTDQPLNTLDQQGSRWNREEWEKTLNIFDIDTIDTGNNYHATGTVSNNALTVTSTQSGTAYVAYKAEVEKNTNYYFNYTSSGSYSLGRIYDQNISTSLLTGVGTFNSGSNSYIYILFYTGSTSGNTTTYSNIMINKGDHLYPYQPYSGKVIHQVDITPLQNRDVVIYNTSGTKVKAQSDESSGVLSIKATDGLNATYSSGKVNLKTNLQGLSINGSNDGITYNGLTSLTARFTDGFNATVGADSVEFKLANHASNQNTYGLGTTSLYGHNKIKDGDLKGLSYADGVAASQSHTHSQYLDGPIPRQNSTLYIYKPSITDYNKTTKTYSRLDYVPIIEGRNYWSRESERIIGGTVAFNQLIPAPTTQSSSTVKGLTVTRYTNGKITIVGTTNAIGPADIISNCFNCIADHKYLCVVQVKKLGTSTLPTETNTYRFRYGDNINAEWLATSTIKSANATSSITTEDFMIYTYAVNVNVNIEIYPQLIDLTQMFGSTIADYLYSLEQVETGRGVAYFKTLFPKPYYSFTTGSLQSVKVYGRKNVGINQWDEEWEVGEYNNNGSKNDTGDCIRCKDYIDILPSTTYYFNVVGAPGGSKFWVCWYDANKNFISRGGYLANASQASPTNARYMTFNTASAYGTTYNNDICINISDSSINGTYFPYEENIYAYGNIELRGTLKLDSNNNIYYDGDEYTNDGKITRNYKSYTFTGEETDSGSQGSCFWIGIPGTGIANGNAVMVGWTYDTFANVNAGVNEKTMTFINDAYRRVGFYSSSITSVSALKSALAGKTIIYKCSDITEEQATPFAKSQKICYYGTEEWLDTRDIQVPVYEDRITFYPYVGINDFTVSTQGSSVTDSPVISVVKNNSTITVTKSNDISLSSLSILNTQDARIEIRRGSGNPWKIGIRNLDLNTGELSLYQGTDTQTPFIRVSDASSGKIELYKDLDVNGFIREYAKSGSTTLTSLQDKYAYKIPLQNTIPTDRDYKAGDLWFDTTTS